MAAAREMQRTVEEERDTAWPHALLIIAASSLVVIGSWNAPFTTYDDTAHLSGNPALAPEVPITSYFIPRSDEAYFPVTTLSWRWDRFLFSGWMPQWLGSWAPGVRLMNWVYHALAALILWRLLGRLGLTKREALFIAVVFALHPTACESVCWATERKTVLAGLFGFLSLWLWVGPRSDGPEAAVQTTNGGLAPKDRHMAHSVQLAFSATSYLLALMSKQSALGLFPIVVLLQVMGFRHTSHDTQSKEARGRQIRSFLALVPFGIVTAAFVYLGVHGHRSWMAAPPGGSIVTALMTDTWIFVRYIINLVLPTNLSAAYGIEPITSFSNTRMWLCLFGLLTLAVFTVNMARSRKRAIFGWLWFYGALGPVMNLVALPALMTDRYLYLALPGFFLVAVETTAGIWCKRQDSQIRISSAHRRWYAGLATAYLAALGTLALQRSFVWGSTYEIFADAVSKEPKAAYARYGLGQAHGTAWYQLKKDPDPKKRAAAAEQRRLWMESWERMFDCVDVDRQLRRAEVALRLGDFHLQAEDERAARSYFNEASRVVPGVKDLPEIRSDAYSRLAALELKTGNHDNAIGLLDRSVGLFPSKLSYRVQRAIAHLTAAKAARDSKDRKRQQDHMLHARKDLSHLPDHVPFRAKAQEELERLAEGIE